MRGSSLKSKTHQKVPVYQRSVISISRIPGNKEASLSLSITERRASLSDGELSSACRSASSRQEVHQSRADFGDGECAVLNIKSPRGYNWNKSGTSCILNNLKEVFHR